jgi:replicative DNA helicase
VNDKSNPTYDLEVEKALLGALIIDPDGLIELEPILRPLAFRDETHQAIYAAMLKLHHDQEAIDIITLSAALNGHTDMAYLTGLTITPPSSLHAKEYARIITGLHTSRFLIQVCQATATKAYDRNTDAEEAVSFLERMLIKIRDNRMDPDTIIKDDLLALMEETEKRVEAGGAMIGLPTGFVDLDRILGGLKPPQLIIAAGRPGMGKSAWESAVSTLTAKNGGGVLRFNLEMDPVSLARRMTAAESGIAYKVIEEGRFQDEDEYTEFHKSVGRLSGLPMWIRSGGFTVEQIASIARRMHYREGLSLVTVDYLQRCQVSSSSGRLVEDVTRMSNVLKNLTLELNIPVLVLSQLSRKCEERKNKRPILSDLRDSGTIEQDADAVIFIYRDEYYEPETLQPNVAEFNVAKNRNGPTGQADLFWQKENMTFKNLKKINLNDPL